MFLFWKICIFADAQLSNFVSVFTVYMCCAFTKASSLNKSTTQVGQTSSYHCHQRLREEENHRVSMSTGWRDVMFGENTTPNTKALKLFHMSKQTDNSLCLTIKAHVSHAALASVPSSSLSANCCQDGLCYTCASGLNGWGDYWGGGLRLVNNVWTETQSTISAFIRNIFRSVFSTKMTWFVVSLSFQSAMHCTLYTVFNETAGNDVFTGVLAACG